MASLDWEQTRRDGVTLVELAVTTAAEEWVRVESELQPVWPPRRQGVPASGWDETGFEGRVDPEAPLVVGYASPATPAEPPARVQILDEKTDTESDASHRIVRTLGTSAPPQDAVPTPATTDSSLDTDGTPASQPPPASTGPDGSAIEPWFEAVEGRLADAEQLAGVSGADEARAAMDALGGIEAVRELQARVDQDRQELRSLGERQRHLLDRLDTVDIPLATLERVT